MEGGDNVQVKGDSHVTVEDGLLTIAKPTEKDAGNYTCRFSTAAADDVQDTIHVISEYRKPVLLKLIRWYIGTLIRPHVFKELVRKGEYKVRMNWQPDVVS